MQIYTGINLNKVWVITKKYNGQIYFYNRGHCVKKSSLEKRAYFNASNYFINSEELAIQKVTELNANRKKCKFIYENAGKYFVNSFELAEYEDSIKTYPKIITNNSQIKTFSSAVEACKARILRNIDNCNKRMKDIDAIVEERITRLRTDYEQEKKNNQTSIESYSLALQTLNNSEEMSKLHSELETSSDKMAMLLFGKKA